MRIEGGTGCPPCNLTPQHLTTKWRASKEGGGPPGLGCRETRKFLEVEKLHHFFFAKKTSKKWNENPKNDPNEN